MRFLAEGSEEHGENAELESPSLFTGVEDGPPAYEVKFLLDEDTAGGVEAMVRPSLALDRHADPSRGNSYPITSLYTDTAEFDVYRRTPAAGGCKYRVRKRRSPAGPEGHAEWFREAITAQGLSPVCRIAYDRVAYLGIADGHTVRVTLDRHVRGEAADQWEIQRVGNAPVLLAGQVICEFKFRLAMPGLFKNIVAELGLTPGTVSKYRRFMQTRLGSDDE